MTFRTRLIVLLVSTPLVAFAIVGGLLGKTVTREDSYQHLRVFEDVVSLILNNYVEEVDIDKVMEGAMRGLADGLDSDSSYLTPAEVSLVDRNVALEAGDVGIDLTRQYYLRVVSARDGSPAARAGIRTGDYIRAIESDPTRHMSLFEGTRRLHGPVGSKITLMVLRDSTAEPRPIVLVREAAPAEHVTSRSVAPGVTLVRVSSFEGNAVDAFKSRLDAAVKSGTERLIIDLRATAEGPIDNGVEAARLFVASGTLVKREARGSEPESLVTHQGDGSITLPLVLLVNTGTAGAAEVFAAALSDNKRAELVGGHTLGRAGIQKLVKFSDGSGLLLTSARYLTAAGKPIHGGGLEPTERVDEPDVELGEPMPAGDPVLDKALERLVGKKAAA